MEESDVEGNHGNKEKRKKKRKEEGSQGRKESARNEVRKGGNKE